jgi:hypothetical protein
MIHLALGAPYETKPYIYMEISQNEGTYGYLQIIQLNKPCLACIEIQFFRGSPILRNHHILALISSDFGDTFSLFEEAQMDLSMMPARYYADPAHISVIPSSIFCWGLPENGEAIIPKVYLGGIPNIPIYISLLHRPGKKTSAELKWLKYIKMGLLSSHCFSCRFLSPQRSAGISTQFERLTGWRHCMDFGENKVTSVNQGILQPRDAAFFPPLQQYADCQRAAPKLNLTEPSCRTWHSHLTIIMWPMFCAINPFSLTLNTSKHLRFCTCPIFFVGLIWALYGGIYCQGELPLQLVKQCLHATRVVFSSSSQHNPAKTNIEKITNVVHWSVAGFLCLALLRLLGKGELSTNWSTS